MSPEKGQAMTAAEVISQARGDVLHQINVTRIVRAILYDAALNRGVGPDKTIDVEDALHGVVQILAWQLEASEKLAEALDTVDSQPSDTEDYS